MRRAAAVLLLVLLGSALSVPASGVPIETNTVTVDQMAFSPSEVLAKQGATITWDFQEGGHTTTSLQGFWDSGYQVQGDTFAHTFNSAGTFHYHCQFHAVMTGFVAIGLKAVKNETSWRLRWATEPATDTRDYDVQIRRIGASKWQSFRRDTTKAAGTFSPARTGRWSVRARTSNTDLGKSSGWSPVQTVKVG